jgi:hypothetical protein
VQWSDGSRYLVAIKLFGLLPFGGQQHWDKAWNALERAHILSQPFWGPHLANHWEMLVFAAAQRDAREVVGQIMRLALAPLGAPTGRYPVGNIGRATVSAFQPMPIPDDLRQAMADPDRT